MFVCLSVCPHDVSKTDAARITRLDIEIFHCESWKDIYFGVKRSKVTSHKNIVGMGFCTLVSAGFLQLIYFFITISASTLLIGHQKEHLVCKTLNDEVLVWLYIWCEV